MCTDSIYRSKHPSICIVVCIVFENNFHSSAVSVRVYGGGGVLFPRVLYWYVVFCLVYLLPPPRSEYAGGNRIAVRSFVGDICQPETIERAFVDGGDVDCVFHCAAYVDFQFPPDLVELERVNLMGKT